MNTKNILATTGVVVAVVLSAVSMYKGTPTVSVNVPAANPTPVQVINNVPEQAAPVVNVAPAKVTVDAPKTFGAFASPEVYNKLSFFGGVMYGNTNASTSVGSGTMKQSDFDGFNTVLLTPTGAAATKTLTFPASSTLRSWLPKAGNMQETCFLNSSTTAAATITFAAGTGIDLETASSSPTDLVLLANNTACFKFIRKTATASTFDIAAVMTEYTDGD